VAFSGTAGALPCSVRVVEQEEVAVSYGPSGSVRLHVKAVGELQLSSGVQQEHQRADAKHPAAAVIAVAAGPRQPTEGPAVGTATLAAHGAPAAESGTTSNSFGIAAGTTHARPLTNP
jgi:hypothetical protein